MKGIHALVFASVFALAILLSGCIQPPVCGNGICEIGETQTCPEDCFVSICGNGVCEAGETPLNCPEDCKETPECIKEGGTGTSSVDKCCAGLTEVGNCTGDGQTCGCGPGFICTYCGDGTCGLGENACNCLEDCPLPEMHLECKVLKCVEVVGAGEDQCSKNNYCECIAADIAPEPPDGKVDISDLGKLANNYDREDCSAANNYCDRADINQDGKVNDDDNGILSEYYGEECEGLR